MGTAAALAPLDSHGEAGRERPARFIFDAEPCQTVAQPLPNHVVPTAILVSLDNQFALGAGVALAGIDITSILGGGLATAPQASPGHRGRLPPTVEDVSPQEDRMLARSGCPGNFNELNLGDLDGAQGVLRSRVRVDGREVRREGG